jgi:hypothetical protein
MKMRCLQLFQLREMQSKQRHSSGEEAKLGKDILHGKDGVDTKHPKVRKRIACCPLLLSFLPSLARSLLSFSRVMDASILHHRQSFVFTMDAVCPLLKNNSASSCARAP